MRRPPGSTFTAQVSGSSALSACGSETHSSRTFVSLRRRQSSKEYEASDALAVQRMWKALGGKAGITKVGLHWDRGRSRLQAVQRQVGQVKPIPSVSPRRSRASR